MIQISKVGMPKACISCQSFICKGFALNENGKKAKYGSCSKLNKGVFAAEVCSNYKQEPDAEVAA